MRIINFNNKSKYLIIFICFFILFVVYCFIFKIKSAQNDDNYTFSFNNRQKYGKMEKAMNSFKTIKTKCNYGIRGPRILCAIFTHRDLHKSTLLPVHNTWAKRFRLFILIIYIYNSVLGMYKTNCIQLNLKM